MPWGTFICYGGCCCCCCSRKKAATFGGSCCCNILRISIAYFRACLKNAIADVEKGCNNVAAAAPQNICTLNCCSTAHVQLSLHLASPALTSAPTLNHPAQRLIDCCNCCRTSEFIRFAYRRRSRVAFLSAQLLRQVSSRRAFPETMSPLSATPYSLSPLSLSLLRLSPTVAVCASSCQQKSRKSLINFQSSQTNVLQAWACSVERGVWGGAGLCRILPTFGRSENSLI